MSRWFTTLATFAIASASLACYSPSSTGPHSYPSSEVDGGPGEQDAGPHHDVVTPEGGLSPDSASDGASYVGPDGAVDNDTSEQYTSGTRLKAMWLVTSDGARQFLTWHDSQLNLDCHFDFAADGQLRCLPNNSLVTDPTQGFADPLCTQPVTLYGGSACPVPSVVLSSDPTGCPTRVHAYSLGSVVSATHYGNFGGTCETGIFGAAFPGGAGTFYALGAEFSVSTYAAATYVNGPMSGGVIAVYTEGSDGSNGFDHWMDAAGSFGCSFFQAADESWRCLPAKAAQPTGTLYTNATCSVSVMQDTESGCSDTYGVIYTRDSSCVVVCSVYSLGTKLPASTVPYYGSSGQCSPYNGISAGTDSYPIGSELVPGAFTQATLLAAAGSTRLQPVNLKTTGSLLQRESWMDSARNEPCSFATAADGQMRCLPTNAVEGGGYFSDSGCTAPLVQQSSTTTCALAPYMISNDTACPSQSHVYPVDVPWTGAVYVHEYSGSTTKCITYTRSSTDLFHSVGPEFTPATFESAQEVSQ